MTSARRAERATIAIALLLLAAIFVALGIWQLERRVWKHGLIAAVDSRVHAPPVAPPGPLLWPGVDAESDAYRHVRVTGRFVQGRRTLVRAVTDLGAGYWAMVPLDTGRFTLLVNRGFLPQSTRALPSREPDGIVTVTGLLRITEPGGGFLRHNEPDSGKWYSRDVAAIARANAIASPAPYFVDAEAADRRPGEPIGGLTVIAFPDNHLSYALTWFALAALCVYGLRLFRSARHEVEKTRWP